MEGGAQFNAIHRNRAGIVPVIVRTYGMMKITDVSVTCYTESRVTQIRLTRRELCAKNYAQRTMRRELLCTGNEQPVTIKRQTNRSFSTSCVSPNSIEIEHRA